MLGRQITKVSFFESARACKGGDLRSVNNICSLHLGHGVRCLTFIVPLEEWAGPVRAGVSAPDRLRGHPPFWLHEQQAKDAAKLKLGKAGARSFVPFLSSEDSD